MPKIKVFSGKDVIKILGSLGFVIGSQKGSHVKLIRFKSKEKQVLVIPNHKEIDRGTLRAILRQMTKYIQEEKIKKYFYSD